MVPTTVYMYIHNVRTVDPDCQPKLVVIMVFWLCLAQVYNTREQSMNIDKDHSMGYM